jgi:predicted DNA-binding transcriptional regulator YafY
MAKHEDRAFNRTERLFALILLLQNKPNMSARNLADHFGVSRRTIFRDLRALTESGVPLTYAEGGGYEILDGYQLPPLMLSAREAATLLIGAGFAKLQPDRSLSQDADQVALKILSVLPREVRGYVEQLQESTVLDPFWQHAATGSEDEPQGRWYDLSEAVSRQRRVLMEYATAGRDEATRRTIDPLGLVYYTDHWNLIAFDHLRGGVRNFRLDRILKMHMLSERFEPPVNFDLNAYLVEKGTSLKNERVRIVFDERSYLWAKRSMPARAVEERRDGGSVEVTFDFENMDYVARWLLRFGAGARVLAPEGLLNEVRRLALGIVAQHPENNQAK